MKRLSFTICLLILTVIVIHAQIPSDGLVGYWPFNGNANDESGNGNDGTVNGATLTNDRFDKALCAYSFTDEDSILISDADMLSFPQNAFTISFWVYLNSGSISDNVIINKRELNSNNPEYLISKPLNSDYPRCYFWTQDYSTIIDPNMGTTNMSEEVWENWSVTCDNTTLKIYKNGSLVSQGLIESGKTLFNGPGELTFGFGGDANNTNYLNGKLDDIRIYNRALDITEIETIYNEEPGYFEKDQTLSSLPRAFMDWGDYDSDGDYDLLMTGNYTAALCKNNNGVLTAIDNNIFKRKNPSYTFNNGLPYYIYSLPGLEYSSIEWGDYNNDNLLDFIITGKTSPTSADPTYLSMLFKNLGNNTFENTVSFEGVGGGDAAWGDINNDGYLDVILTGSTTTEKLTTIYQNDQAGGFNEVSTINLIAAGESHAELGDINNDGLLDIFICGRDNSNNWFYKLYKNMGNNTFNELPNTLPNKKNQYLGFELADMNSDGYLDLIEQSYLYINNSDETFTAIQIGEAGATTTSIGDYDNDGALDALFGPKLYNNDGDNNYLKTVDFDPEYTRYCSFSDINSDGKLDFLRAGSYNLYDENGWSIGIFTKTETYINKLVVANNIPSTPQNLYTKINGVDVTFYWDKTTDEETPSDGLSYEIYVYEEGESNYIRSPQANINSGKRLIQKRGSIQWSEDGYTLKGFYVNGKTYKWSVQAIDGGLEASQFAAEKIISQCYTASFSVSTGSVPISGANISIDSQDIITDANGEAIIGLANGTYSYTVSASGYDDETGTVVIDNANQTINITMSVPSYTTTFNVSDGSNPISGANISINNQSLTTDASGEAAFNLENGTYSYTITASGYYDETGTIVVENASQTIDVTMNVSSFTITFEVSDGSNPISGADISINSQNLTTDAAGEATIELENGTYSYTITASGYDNGTGTIVVENASQTIDVTMNVSSFTITFEVSDGSNPISGANISINSQNLTTDASGEATIELKNGTYSYTVSASGYDDETGSVVVDNANETVVVIMNALSYTITFNVSDGSNPISGANISINSQNLTTDASGETTIELENGTYSYTITASGYDDKTGSVVINNANETVDVTLSTTTGIVENDDKTFKIYPNPANKYITISLSEYNNLNDYKIRIVNLTGKVLYETKVNQSSYQIDITSLPNDGLLIIQMLNDIGNLIEVKKVIIQ